MFNRRNFLKRVNYTLLSTAISTFAVSTGQAGLVRKSSKSAAENARLKRCRIYTDKYNMATDKLDKLVPERSKIRKKRIVYETDYKAAQRAADETLKKLKAKKAWKAKFKAKPIGKSHIDARLKYRTRVLKSVDREIETLNDYLAVRADSELYFGRLSDKFKAKEFKLDSQIKKQRRLRDKYKKLMAKNKCGKIKRDKVKTYDEFEGGD